MSVKGDLRITETVAMDVMIVVRTMVKIVLRTVVRTMVMIGGTILLKM